MRRSMLGMSITLLLALSPVANAMRCGNQLVLEGYSFAKVQKLCGPADTALPTQTKYLILSENREVDALPSATQSVSEALPIQVDVWIYEGSNNDLTRNLIFRNGRLERIDIGDH